ncbi:hypothetical protein C8Q77DRAFT_448854 [Trametes polyzona]|nr:hypothetical protein C8Q77DRAFT_448854 [Trametes polyzona]
MAHVVYVDDTDPRIQYSDGWLTSTAKDAFHGTMHGSAEHGLTLTFNFTGTRVGVVGGTGDVNKFGVSSQTYELDGEPSRIVLGDKSASPDTFFYNFTYYESPDLASGEHTLVLTTITVNIVPPHIFWLDYIWYTTGNAAPPSIASSSLPANSPAPTLSSTPAPRSTHALTTTSSLSTTARSSSTSAAPSITVAQFRWLRSSRTP